MSLTTELLGRSSSDPDARNVFFYRFILGVGAFFLLVFGLYYRYLQPGAVDPLWMRGGLAILWLGIAGGSYLSEPIRRQLGRLYRGYLYLIIFWLTGILIANQYAWLYGAGLILIHALTGLLFGIGLRRIRSFRWFLGTATAVPLAGLLVVSDPQTPPLFLVLSLAALATIVERVTTWRIREAHHLRNQNQVLNQIRQNVTDAVWISDPDTQRFEFISKAYEEIWGRSVEQLKENPMSFLEAVHPEDRERVESAVRVQTNRPDEYNETYRVLRPDGEIRWVRDQAAGVYGENGELFRVIGIASDVTKETELKNRLQHQILHDNLTDLANRSLFFDRLKEVLSRAERTGNGTAILYLDLNDFKSINDHHGHAVGDTVLKTVADRLRAHTRAHELAARLGGDEFAVLLEEIDSPHEADRTAERLGEELFRPVQIGDEDLPIEGSIGIAAAKLEGMGDPLDASEVEEVGTELVRRADEAMYEAKQNPDILIRRYGADHEDNS